MFNKCGRSECSFKEKNFFNHKQTLFELHSWINFFILMVIVLKENRKQRIQHNWHVLNGRKKNKKLLLRFKYQNKYRKKFVCETQKLKLYVFQFSHYKRKHLVKYLLLRSWISELYRQLGIELNPIIYDELFYCF